MSNLVRASTFRWHRRSGCDTPPPPSPYILLSEPQLSHLLSPNLGWPEVELEIKIKGDLKVEETNNDQFGHAATISLCPSEAWIWILFQVDSYTLICSDPAKLASLYNNSSVFIYGGDKFHGAHEISELLNVFPLKGSSYNITSFNYMHSERISGLLISVTGTLKLPGRDDVLVFSQMFCARPTPQSVDGFHLDADIFRLEYA